MGIMVVIPETKLIVFIMQFTIYLLGIYFFFFNIYIVDLVHFPRTALLWLFSFALSSPVIGKAFWFLPASHTNCFSVVLDFFFLYVKCTQEIFSLVIISS